MDDEKTKQQDAAPQLEEQKAADARKPYQKPTLEIHSDSNLWAFGTLGG